MASKGISVQEKPAPVNTLVFINYRSCDEPFAALFLDKRLSQRFGRGTVFRDCRTIRPGTHFPAEIWRSLQECRALIAVIGERWLRLGADGQRLIDHQDDYVRMEIAEALRRNILVVPVLVGDVSLPSARELPADLAELASRQYLHLRVRGAEQDASRLVDELADLLGGARLRATRPAVPRRFRAEPPRVATGSRIVVTTNYFEGAVDAHSATFGNSYGAR